MLREDGEEMKGTHLICTCITWGHACTERSDRKTDRHRQTD